MRDRLLFTGFRLAAEKGPEGFSLDDVIAAADVARVVFYKDFKSPAELVQAFFRLVGPNVDAGIASGRFGIAPREIGLALIGGLSIGAMHSLANHDLPDDFPERVAETLLLALGLERAEAVRIARLPLILPAPLFGWPDRTGTVIGPQSCPCSPRRATLRLWQASGDNTSIITRQV